MSPLTLEIAPLRPKHRSAVRLHLLALSADDRYARFGLGMSDQTLLHWAAAIDWERQRWWGAWHADDLGLLGVLQLVPTLEADVWELAMSVARPLRRQGVATRLISAAVEAMPALQGLACHHGHAAVQGMGRRLGWGLQTSAQHHGVLLLRNGVGARAVPAR